LFQQTRVREVRGEGVFQLPENKKRKMISTTKWAFISGGGKRRGKKFFGRFEEWNCTHHHLIGCHERAGHKNVGRERNHFSIERGKRVASPD